MGPVVGPLLDQAGRVAFPIEPAVVEWSVGEADESGFIWSAASQQRVTHCGGIEPRRGLHDPRITPCDVLMAQRGVEVVAYTRLEPIKIGVHKKSVAAGLDAGKRDGEQIGDRWPVEPVGAHRRWLERQAQGKIRAPMLSSPHQWRLPSRLCNSARRLSSALSPDGSHDTEHADAAGYRCRFPTLRTSSAMASSDLDT